jgi:hypothetical protein
MGCGCNLLFGPKHYFYMAHVAPFLPIPREPSICAPLIGYRARMVLNARPAMLAHPR